MLCTAAEATESSKEIDEMDKRKLLGFSPDFPVGREPALGISQNTRKTCT